MILVPIFKDKPRFNSLKKMCFNTFLLRYISVMYFAWVHNKVTTLVYRRPLDTIFHEQLICN